jgi:Na+/proline symporter
MDSSSKIGVFDYMVVIGILLFSLIIGLYHGYRKQFKEFINLFKRRKIENDSHVEMEETPDTIQKIEQGKNTQVSNYLTANSSMSILPIAFSLIATMFSSNTILALPGL